MNVLLAGGNDLVCPHGKGGVFIVRAGKGQKTGLTDAVHDAADVGPINAAGAHGARLTGGVKRAVPQEILAVGAAGTAGQHKLRMSGGVMGIALGVTLRHEHISLAVHQDRAERRITAGAGLFGRLVGKAKIIR